jgi:hypothetical protein
MPSVLDPEPLGHCDLHRCHVLAVPHRLEHGVGEAQVHELIERHLPQEVVDPVELRLLDVLVELARQLARRGEIVAERLLDDHALAVGDHVRLGQPLDHRGEQRGWDLEVEGRVARVAQRLLDRRVGLRLAEVPSDVGQPPGEAREHLVVQLLAGLLD